MNWMYLVAGILAAGGVVFHGIFGYLQVPAKLQASSLPSSVFGDGQLTLWMLRMSWHSFTVILAVTAVVLISLEFSRTLLLVGEFFFAGALGREVAHEVTKFLDEEAPVTSSHEGHASAVAGDAVTIEFKGVTFTYPGTETPAIQELELTVHVLVAQASQKSGRVHPSPLRRPDRRDHHHRGAREGSSPSIR